MTSQLLVPRNRSEKFALGYARGGYDNSALSERGIRGIFYDGLETTFDQTWASQIGIYMPSDTLEETHRWLGQTPGFREWVGGLQSRGMNDFEIKIRNRDFEDTINPSLHDWRRDKTGHIVRRIGELGQRANNHWDEIAVTDILEGNPLSYDGQNFFSATHQSGSAGVRSNLLTSADLPNLGVTDPVAPTREEAASILADLMAFFFRYQDDQGKKANQGARNFMLMCRPEIWPAFQNAIQDLLYQQGGSNRLANLGWTIMALPEPLLDEGALSDIYIFRTDAPSSRPMILQEEMVPEIKFLGPDTEFAITSNSVLVSARMSRGIGPGEWRHAIKATMSA